MNFCCCHGICYWQAKQEFSFPGTERKGKKDMRRRRHLVFCTTNDSMSIDSCSQSNMRDSPSEKSESKRKMIAQKESKVRKRNFSKTVKSKNEVEQEMNGKQAWRRQWRDPVFGIHSNSELLCVSPWVTWTVLLSKGISQVLSLFLTTDWREKVDSQLLYWVSSSGPAPQKYLQPKSIFSFSRRREEDALGLRFTSCLTTWDDDAAALLRKTTT